MADPFEEIAPVYANIISEAKGRLRIVERVLAGPIPAGVMDYVAVSDLCALQLRKTFEAIALGCLVAHGELAGKRLKDDTYRADKLLKGLERLNPDFYPKPCKILQSEDNRMEVGDVGGEWLTKDALRRYYFEFDHEMHVGTLTRRSNRAKAISVHSFEMILRQTKALIMTHWICLIDGRRMLCDASQEGATEIKVLTPD